MSEARQLHLICQTAALLKSLLDGLPPHAPARDGLAGYANGLLNDANHFLGEERENIRRAGIAPRRVAGAGR